MTRSEFFAKYLSAATAVTKGTKVFPATVLAMAALESANGGSKLTREANNFFGIKTGTKWKGEVYKIETREYDSEHKPYMEIANFRKYPLPQASFADFVGLIEGAKRYKPALEQKNALEQIAAIRDAGYSTDPDYAIKAGSVLDSLREFAATVKKKAPHCLPECSCFWGDGLPIIS